MSMFDHFVELVFNSSLPNPGRREKIKLIFIFTLLFGASKGFMKAFKAFIKPFEMPQRSVKMKIYRNSYFNTNFHKCMGREGLKG